MGPANRLKHQLRHHHLPGLAAEGFLVLGFRAVAVPSRDGPDRGESGGAYLRAFGNRWRAVLPPCPCYPEDPCGWDLWVTQTDRPETARRWRCEPDDVAPDSLRSLGTHHAGPGGETGVQALVAPEANGQASDAIAQMDCPEVHLANGAAQDGAPG